MQETLVQFLGQEDLLEKGKATHSSILAYTVHGVAKSATRLNNFHFHLCNYHVSNIDICSRLYHL